jgi:hypothetical protein
MKIAIENDAATNGDIQGYSNTGWRVLYDEGAVEGGSSGSPLLDPNKKVVGQLYSSTQSNSPCNTQIRAGVLITAELICHGKVVVLPARD